MGADFIHVAVPITRTRDEALASLRAMSNETLIDKLTYGTLYLEDSGDTWLMTDDDGEIINDENGNPILNRADLIARCEEAINITYDSAEDRYRLAGSMRINDCVFAVGGGASWGDSPDYFDDLCIAYELGVTYDESKQLKWVDA